MIEAILWKRVDKLEQSSQAITRGASFEIISRTDYVAGNGRNRKLVENLAFDFRILRIDRILMSGLIYHVDQTFDSVY